MKRKTILFSILGLVLLLLFVFFTVSLAMYDVKAIGPENSRVGYARINSFVRERLGVNFALYTVTDWAGLFLICIMIGFAVLGLSQWKKRRSLFKVDPDLLLLGAFYVLVFLLFFFFERCIINYRPVLIEGVLEASYPSSTTLLAMCVLPTAMLQWKRRLSRSRVRRICMLFAGFSCVLLIVLRLLSGVHWLTDIVGGILLGASCVLLYAALECRLNHKK